MTTTYDLIDLGNIVDVEPTENGFAVAMYPQDGHGVLVTGSFIQEDAAQALAENIREVLRTYTVVPA